MRYRGSYLGYVWSMVNPLLMMTVLWFVFSHAMKVTERAYPLYILSGVMCWNLFSQSLVLGTNSFVGNGGLLKKIKVPAFVFPAASILSCLVNFILALAPFVVVSLFLGDGHLSGLIVLLPLLVFPLVLFIFGLVLALASLNVQFRDVGHTLEPLLSILFYSTPIFYVLENMSPKIQSVLSLNPLVYYIANVRSALYYDSLPDMKIYMLTLLLACVSLVIGALIYLKRRKTFIYNL